MTPKLDDLYAVYELYLSNRKPGEPMWTFSGWLQHAGLSEKFPAEELGPKQRQCLAGPLSIADRLFQAGPVRVAGGWLVPQDPRNREAFLEVAARVVARHK